MGDATPEEISETQVQVGRVLKTLAAGWLGYNLYKIGSGSGTCKRATEFTRHDEIIPRLPLSGLYSRSLCAQTRT